jgi:apolipoprotein N-acyltransferase
LAPASCALIAGALSALAMAPFFLWPVLWLTLPALVWLIDGAAWRASHGQRMRWHTRPAVAAAEIGWWWGFGYFLAGLYWIGEAFLVEAEVFAALMPVAVVLMPAGLALFYGAACALAASFWKAGAWRAVALALSLSAAEWLRGHVLSGFPWNVLGYALTYPLPLMQSVAVLGIYGLTLLAVLIFALPPVLWNEPALRLRRARAAALAVAVLPLALLVGLGYARLALAAADTVPGVKIRIVQPSVPQREKWRREHQARFFQDHLDLSARDPQGKADALAGITHVIWPEAAMPFPALDTPEALAAIGDLLPEGTVLIAGAIRVERMSPDGRGPYRFFNSLLVLGRRGVLLALYDKIYLVPFGEFLPCAGCLGPRPARGGFQERLRLRPLAAANSGHPALARGGPARLLRSHFPPRDRPRSAAAGRHCQSHQRRMVRRFHGAAPALPPGARARCRGGASPGPRCQQRRFGGLRRLRPRAWPAGPQRARRDRRAAAGCPLAATLRPVGDAIFLATWLLGAALLGWGVASITQPWRCTS